MSNSTLVMNVRWDGQRLKPVSTITTMASYWKSKEDGLFRIGVLGAMRAGGPYATPEEAKEAIEAELDIRSGPIGAAV